MANALAMNTNSRGPSLLFNSKTFGENIRLEENGSKAVRHTSFDNGITFTSGKIGQDERLCMKIIDVDETGQWLGSLAVGFTQIDPNSIAKTDLLKSALPNLCTRPGVSYIKRIFEKLTRGIIITFYYNKGGAFYILDGKEHELWKNVEVNKPLWGVIDIYGNVKAVALTEAPQIISDGEAFFKKYARPDRLSIQHFKQLKPNHLQEITFHDIHGPELEIYCDNKVVRRRNVQRLSQPYLFINLPLSIGDEFYIRILSIDQNFRTPGIVGVTNYIPPTCIAELNKLPRDEPMGLYDRKESWIFNEEAFDEKLKELDEYRFKFEENGDITVCRNNETNSSRTVLLGDTKTTIYPFFYLNGRITALSVFGLVSSTRVAPVPSKPEPKNDEEGLCQLCLTDKADCVFVPCGHIFFCSDCRSDFEEKSKRECPTCRQTYSDIFQISNS